MIIIAKHTAVVLKIIKIVNDEIIIATIIIVIILVTM